MNSKDLEKFAQSNSVPSRQFTPTASYQDICPCCGYCRHCGRQNSYPYVPYQPAPWYPAITWTGTRLTTTTGNG